MNGPRRNGPGFPRTVPSGSPRSQARPPRIELPQGLGPLVDLLRVLLKAKADAMLDKLKAIELRTPVATSEGAP